MGYDYNRTALLVLEAYSLRATAIINDHRTMVAQTKLLILDSWGILSESNHSLDDPFARALAAMEWCRQVAGGVAAENGGTRAEVSGPV